MKYDFATQLRKFSFVVALGAGLFGFAKSARADGISCTANVLRVEQDKITIGCANSGSLFVIGSSACGAAPNADIQRIWASLVQASILSGKVVNVIYNPAGACGPSQASPMVYEVTLVK